ncbi:hypothetical protein OAO03_02060 [Candidatus Pelagibacter ubique]|nr:hypothetical protein [Candidatus Pelagibacter ubique]
MEFNTYDLYLNQVKEDDVFNSNEYKYLKENNIDTAEIEGIDKDPDAGEIKFDKDQNISEEDNKLLLKDVTDFILDIPRDTFISILRGGTNGFQFVNNFAGAVGLTGEETTEEFNLKFDKIKSDLDNAQEDSPFVTKMIAMAGQDAMYTYPIYKKLQKAGLPKMWRLPLSFALGGALAFDKKESLFVDSNSMRNLKAYIGIAKDTPIEEMYDKTVQAIEFGAFGKIFDDVIGMAKGIKTMNKDRLKQADIALGGAAGSAAVVEQFTEDPNQATSEMMPNAEAIEEKKNPNFNDDEIIPGTVNEYGFEKTSSLVPVFKSVLKETAKKLPNKGSGEQIFNTLKNTPGLKQQELKWSGLDDFLKEKKTVTKQEVKEYLENNTLDIEEVKFGGDVKTVKLSDDIEFKKNKFESKVLADLYKKDPELRGEVPEELLEELNYDLYAPIAMTKKGIKDKVMPMDFNTMRTILGENPNIANFKKLPNGNLRNLNTADVDFFDKGYFEINPFDFEKYQVEEAVRKFRQGDVKAPKFESQTEPGGEEYTELVFKIKQGGMDKGIPTEIKGLDNAGPFGSDDAGEFVTKIKNTPYKNPSHMNVKSEIAHVRFKTRMNGNMKVLTVEEMQSDFAIAALKSNKRSSADNPKITDFPFRNTWYELTTKRLIRYAADNDFDAVAIPKGSIPAARYGEEIGKLQNVLISKEPFNPSEWKGWNNKGKSMNNYNEQFVLEFRDEKGVVRKTETYLDLEDVHKIIGQKNIKDLDRLKLNAQGGAAFFPLDKPIIIGDGKGKVELYDKAIPSFLKKYGKKWNAKVYDEELSMDMDDLKMLPVTIIQLTDEMKKSVQQDGQALFNIFGIGSGAAIGSNAILDSDRNNTISNITEN